MQHNDSWSWTRRTFMKSSVAGALLFAGKLLGPPAVRSHVCHGKRLAPRGDRDSGANYVPAAYPPMLAALVSSSRVSNPLFSRENLVAALRVWRLRDDSGERSAHRRRWDGLVRGLTWRRLRSL
jgi:hypothetical protein